MFVVHDDVIELAQVHATAIEAGSAARHLRQLDRRPKFTSQHLAQVVRTQQDATEARMDATKAQPGHSTTSRQMAARPGRLAGAGARPRQADGKRGGRR